MIQKDDSCNDIINTETTNGVIRMKLHIRYNGQSDTLNAEQVGIRKDTGDWAVREILSGIYEVPHDAFRDMVIDRNPDGIVVRPPAVFG